jgi:hypothetical protein
MRAIPALAATPVGPGGGGGRRHAGPGGISYVRAPHWFSALRTAGILGAATCVAATGRVVILSPNIPDDERAKAAGIGEFLRKPIDGSELVAAVDRYCDRERGPGSPSGGSRHNRPSSPDPA